ncbi:type II toxin-antitoxin system RelE/ParE family toxin [Labrys miyagiensis]|uniref:type II toxin-antitoxin system RelE/ParE family toxin n=1 Tax=Labrys miyagiensis TaxID=346912 RepID=UPI0024E06D5C|nr:type II toxin-antitoxin system RelE/ParE family toxin [Labrys miyagiensis]
MRIIYLPSTKADLRWFRQYYTRHFPEGQKRAREHYYAAVIMLSENPYSGKAIEMGEARELAIPRTPFSLVYAIRNGQIEIIRLWDGRADRSFLDIR